MPLQIPSRDLLSLVEQPLEGVAFLHAKRVAHREHSCAHAFQELVHYMGKRKPLMNADKPNLNPVYICNSVLFTII